MPLSAIAGNSTFSASDSVQSWLGYTAFRGVVMAGSIYGQRCLVSWVTSPYQKEIQEAARKLRRVEIQMGEKVSAIKDPLFPSNETFKVVADAPSKEVLTNQEYAVALNQEVKNICDIMQKAGAIHSELYPQFHRFFPSEAVREKFRSYHIHLATMEYEALKKHAADDAVRDQLEKDKKMALQLIDKEIARAKQLSEYGEKLPHWICEQLEKNVNRDALQRYLEVLKKSAEGYVQDLEKCAPLKQEYQKVEEAIAPQIAALENRIWWIKLIPGAGERLAAMYVSGTVAKKMWGGRAPSLLSVETQGKFYKFLKYSPRAVAQADTLFEKWTREKDPQKATDLYQSLSRISKERYCITQNMLQFGAAVMGGPVARGMVEGTLTQMGASEIIAASASVGIEGPVPYPSVRLERIFDRELLQMLVARLTQDTIARVQALPLVQRASTSLEHVAINTG